MCIDDARHGSNWFVCANPCILAQIPFSQHQSSKVEGCTPADQLRTQVPSFRSPHLGHGRDLHTVAFWPMRWGTKLLQKLSMHELLEALTILDDQKRGIGSRFSAGIWQGIATAAGLNPGPKVGTTGM